MAWALERYKHVKTIGFDYGQRHVVELECRNAILARLRADFPAWAERLGMDHPFDLSSLGQVSETALTQPKAIELAASGLPTPFVPVRNLLFFTFAVAIAYRPGPAVMVGGMCFDVVPRQHEDALHGVSVLEAVATSIKSVKPANVTA